MIPPFYPLDLGFGRLSAISLLEHDRCIYPKANPYSFAALSRTIFRLSASSIPRKSRSITSYECGQVAA